MYTRKQYMDRECSHYEYWAQLVIPNITAMVVNTFGINALEDSRDRAFNDLPLARWDTMHERIRHLVANNVGGILDTLRKIDDTQAKAALERRFVWSQSDSVCVAKQAARMFINQHVHVDTAFRVFPEGDVVALFVNQPEGEGMVSSYQIVGEHSPASLDLLTELPRATTEQATPLLIKLRELGYVVTPYDPPQYEDQEILGLTYQGKIVQWNAENGTTYTSGETPEEFGLDSIRPHERLRLMPWE